MVIGGCGRAAKAKGNGQRERAGKPAGGERTHVAEARASEVKGRKGAGNLTLKSNVDKAALLQMHTSCKGQGGDFEKKWGGAAWNVKQGAGKDIVVLGNVCSTWTKG
jgi:hypothetical protein